MSVKPPSSISLKHILLIICIFVLVRAHEKQLSTTYDGVTDDGYVSYMKLNGTEGAKIQIPILRYLHHDIDYTVMLWFKPMSDDWGKRLSFAFNIKNSLGCYFTETQTLICESFEKCDKLGVSVENVHKGYWTHLTVSGKRDYQSYLLLSSNTNDHIAYDEKSYVIMRQIYMDWYGCVGQCDDVYGFIGGLREFIFIQQMLTRDTALRLKNHLLSFDHTILAYYRFNEESYDKDLYRNQWVTFQGSSLAIDYIPNDICQSLQDYEYYLSITKDNSAQAIHLGDRWDPEFKYYSYSAAIQLRIDDSSCYVSNPYQARSTCNIFHLDEVFMLYLDSQNSFRVYFFALKNFYETYSRSIFIPQNEWLNIQITLTRFDGYKIRVYDMRGKMLDYDNEDRNMQQQLPSRKLVMFQHFRGQVRQFILYKSLQTLPIHFPENGDTSDDNIIAYWKFTKNHLSNKSFKGLTTQSNLSPLKLTFQETPQFESILYTQFDFNSGETDGLLTYPHQLFDGISCNDQNYVPLLQGKNSHFTAFTPEVQLTLNAITVEFWFNQISSIEANRFLFSMKEEKSLKREFFQIFTDKDKTLTCAPFGHYSVRNPLIKYTSYTEQTRQGNTWFHLTCQFKSLDIAQGLLYSPHIDYQAKEIIGNETTFLFSANTSYRVIMGNQFELNSGVNMKVRELRIWPEFRTISQIAEWRYMQFDQRDYLPKTMLTYLRLSEGGFSEFNFANSFNKSVPREVQNSGVIYVKDSNLVICPISTYYINGRCYLNPVSQAIAAILPVHNQTSQTLSWKFTAKYSTLMNESYYESLEVHFSSANAIIQSYIDKAEIKYDLLIPSSAFIMEDIYEIGLSFQNDIKTFQNYQKFQFIPNWCKYYAMQTSGDAENSYLFYNESLGSQNISLTMIPILVKNYCNEISFYKHASHKVNYTIIPELEEMPNLDFMVDENENIQVIIPSGEQYKFPQKQNITIQFQIFYTNDMYEEYLDTSIYRFQDVFQVINFNIPPQTVALSLTVDKPYVLKFEEVLLDASQTQITGYTDGDSGNLTFEWICPTNDSLYICKDKFTPTLEIWSYQIPMNFLNYSQYYEFTVKVTWNKPDGSNETFNATQKIIWYDVLTPQFTLYQPAKVRSTTENIFTLQFDNYNATDLQNVSITWSIVPNLTLPAFTLDKNSTELIVEKGGFATETNYIITVTAQDTSFDLAKRVQQISFKTSSPPFGGNATISPQSGNMTTTEFNISIIGWQSNNEPIVFRAWYGESPNSNTPYELIYNNWTSANQNLTFYATTVNSIIVEITDNSTESQFIVLNPNITVQTSPNITNMISMAKKKDNNIYQRQSYLNGAAMSINDWCGTGKVPTQEEIDEYVSNKMEIIEELEKDIQKIKEDKSNGQQDASYIMDQTVSTLESIVFNSLYLNDYLVEKTISILNQIVIERKTFVDLLVIKDNFDNKFLSILSHLSKYTDEKAYKAIGKRRLQQDTSTMAGVRKSFKEIMNLSDKFSSLLCQAQISSYMDSTYIFAEYLDIIVQKFRPSQDIPSRSFTQDYNKYNYGLGTDFISRVNFNINDLMKEAIKYKSLGQDQEICVQTSYFKINTYPLSKEERKSLFQYSESMVDFKVFDETGERVLFQNHELSAFTEVAFTINEETFINNQTVCMTYVDNWDEKYCETRIESQNFMAVCDCNLINSQFYILMTDLSRLEGDKIEFPEIEYRIVDVYESESSFAYLGIVVFLVAIGFIFSIISITQDRKDLKKCQDPLKSQYKLDILLQASKASEQPLGMWYYKQQDAFSYAISQNSLFTNILIAVHPVLNFLFKFDFQSPRIQRFSLYFFQICFFALINVLWFGKYYRKQDTSRIHSSIDQTDIEQILLVGIIGAFVLLPLPSCFRGSIQGDSQQNQQQNVQQISPEVVGADQANVGFQSSHQTTNNSPNKLNNSILQNSKTQVQVATKNVKLSKAITILFLGVSAGIIAVIVTLSQNNYIDNQQCMVASFYLGLMMGFFVTNFIRVLFNFYLVEKASESNSCLRFLTSSYAVKAFKDIQIIKQADNFLMEKLNFEDNVESVSLRQEDGQKVISEIHKMSAGSENSFDLSKSRGEGLPEELGKYAQTQEINKFKDSQDYDESLPSEKMSSQNMFRSLTKGNEKENKKDNSAFIKYSQVNENQANI